MFAYCNNNPVNGADPCGVSPEYRYEELDEETAKELLEKYYFASTQKEYVFDYEKYDSITVSGTRVVEEGINKRWELIKSLGFDAVACLIFDILCPAATFVEGSIFILELFIGDAAYLSDKYSQPEEIETVSISVKKIKYGETGDVVEYDFFKFVNGKLIEHYSS